MDDGKEKIGEIEFEGLGTMAIEGNFELQSLPHVAGDFARFKISDPIIMSDPELLELCKLSRKYLKCAFNKAIERHGEEIKGNEK